MNYWQYSFQVQPGDQSDYLVAMLSEQRFEGFEETDTHLHAFISEADFSEPDLNALLSQVSGIRYEKKLVENINWNQQWESSFEPVTVGDFAAIRAHFHAPVTSVQHEVIITPKMSFGTGHHNTTFLVIQLMQQLNFQHKSVFDFGTGTGVLAILAEKLGAETVDAIDNDEWSINNTLENIAQNNAVHTNVWLATEVTPGKQYDVVLANINLNVITANLPALRSITKMGGTVLFSGLLRENEPVISLAIEAAGFTIRQVVYKGDWIALEALG